MKQPTFHGRVLLPLSVFADARAGDPLAMERILRYYDGYMNKLCIIHISGLVSSFRFLYNQNNKKKSPL